MVGERKHHTFPSWLSFTLNNPLRRRFDPPRKIIEALGVTESTVVLDFGCGPGFFTIPFAKVAKKVVAVDVQPGMLEKVARYAERSGVTVQCLQSDGGDMSLPDSVFDLIFLSHVYHEVDDKQSFLKEMRRLLKLDGRIVIMERMKKGLLPIGPPVMNIRQITDELREAGFATMTTISVKKNTLMIAANPAKHT